MCKLVVWAAATACFLSLALAPLGARAGQESVEGVAETSRIPVQLFAGEPRGPYETGTSEVFWVNEALDDPSTADPNDKRKVLVQMWYPALVQESAPRAPYVISPQLYGKDSWVHKFTHVETRSVLGAPVMEGALRFPVLIYNHGNGNPHFSATFQMEFLASHGYVVVAIGHPGSNGLERFPDGTSYRNDGVELRKSWRGKEGVLSRESFEYSFVHRDLSLFVKDIGFVLDRLAVLDVDPEHRFYKRLDLGRIGAFGWSLGGALSLQAARDEPRIKAVANLDGWPYGLMGPKGVVTLGSERPVLLMFCPPNSGTTLTAYPGGKVGDGGEIRAEGVEASVATATYFWSLLRRSTADWYHVTIGRTNHGHFSDHSLLDGVPDAQSLHPRAAHAIINAYVLEFFDRHVHGGRHDTPLLSGVKRFPEAMMLRRVGAKSREH